MGKLLVTGATGNLGRQTLELLLESVPADRLAGLARTPERAADLAGRGVDIRQGDYLDQASLVRAFDGVDRLLLVSAQAFTDRNTQHLNAITAAKQAGVKHVIYTAIQRDEALGINQVGVTESDVFTEQALRASGLTYTILYNPMYLDQFDGYVGADAYEKGVRVPPGEGTMAPALLRDLAAGNVAVLTQDGHENKTYTLNGSEAASYRDIAATLSEIHGRTVPYLPVTVEEFHESYVRNGLPEPVAEFLTAWVAGVGLGSFSKSTDDLERLIGYRPTGYREFLEKNYPSVAPRTGSGA
ncbi:SDR family oxidoreductase [Kineosporia sp. J2-2]|uniref:SDR family oxidoreductase n=1 Tax=Kineosporia corallincola TaxID=2835133 RepID=A0ABS5TGJ2_9ACTN|nr:SDR family oxidoreductase [Kineosporia corallincola]MBT0770210.1 SDR family oxidoreductase [Kineosporia corallincola]